MVSTRLSRRSLVGALTVLVSLVPLGAAPALAAPTELFLSEYVEGTSNNKALEIYNGTGAAIDLGAGGYTIQMFFNGATTAGTTVNLTGTVADGDVFVLAQASANATILAQADQTSSASFYNGDDAVVLSKAGVVIDVLGQVGFDPGTEWGTGLVSTADNTLARQTEVCAGDPDGSNAFDPAAEWDGFATDTFTGLGTHAVDCGVVTDTAPAVSATVPLDGGSLAVGENLSVTFDEAVAAAEGAFVVSCESGPVAAAVTGGPTTFTIDPATDLPFGEDCTLSVVASLISDQDDLDPPDNPDADVVIGFRVGACLAPDTPIGAVQGTTDITPITTPVTVQGVVVGDYEGPSPAVRGFFVQDAGDGDDLTSDGIFVFNVDNDSVSLGEVVQVTGTPAEFNGQTQLGFATIEKCGTTATVTPTDVELPVPDATFLERYEGMLVRLPQTLYVTEFFQLGRFGEVVVSSGDRLPQPTDVAEPGADANAVRAANDLNRIKLDDDTNLQNPDPIDLARGGGPLTASNTLRGGDTVTGAVGVLTYSFGGSTTASPNTYRVRVVGDLSDLEPAGVVPDFQPANPRPAAAPEVGGSLSVASFNVLNYFLTLDIGTTPACGPVGLEQECRGAESTEEFTRQRVKLVAALARLDADVVGLIELENTPGVEPLADIVAGLNDAMGAGTYDYVETGVVGTDVIKVGLIYKPGSVQPVGDPAYLDSTVDPRFDEDLHRVPVAQTFLDLAKGEVFTVVVNHLKSKGCTDATGADLDQGDGQACFNAARVSAAQALVEWIDANPTGIADDDVLVIGDLNSYAKEDPIDVFAGAGYVDLGRAFGGAGAYSFVFDGQWGYLDYALGSPSIVSQVTGAAEYHINADEPSVLDYNTNFKSANLITTLFAPDEFRTSDHDPVLVGLDLASFTPVVTANPATLWPPNHKYVTVTVTATAGGQPTTVEITGVTSSEPDSGLGDDDLPNDIVVTGPTTVDLRAERYTARVGRTYTIEVWLTSADGQVRTGVTTVRVPQSQRR